MGPIFNNFFFFRKDGELFNLKLFRRKKKNNQKMVEKNQTILTFDKSHIQLCNSLLRPCK